MRYVKHQSTANKKISNNETNDDIEVSIIIPSRNKYPLNLFTLYSLENQSFNVKKMEVIFINDASTDETEEKLKNYHPPYIFKYIHSTQKLGRAMVRNLGIESASGRILIFLDAEMITEPEFVQNHYNYHHITDNLIVTGTMHSKALYSCIFPEFSDQFTNKIEKLTKENQQIYKRFKNSKHPIETPYPLINKDDIVQGHFKDISYSAYPWFEEIISNYNVKLEGFMFPWMAFLTGNISIKKELITQAGLFDEEFFNYGYEDWELGYRLYKMGVKYVVSNKMPTYHQEHPVEERKWKEAVGNFGLFTIKHHDVDVLILALELARMTDLNTMNNILKEYKSLLKSNPEQFQVFSEKFIYILETIILMLEVDIRHFNIIGAAGFSSEAKKELQRDMQQIQKLERFPNLTKFLATVINS
ncbi:Glycosyltransferase, GT2 family [Bacillus sp. OV166]|uniref:glycosyltransferase family 2 protein n=2 Tax=unclassified Bacillus (in: firmicutes) TaxID=185979 RepID=UPI000A2AA58D|nr:glycosyltransferase [Bacillus sp. OV166]SMQ78110.1 Glycosyltransferase, GT2 family [Bacillus sp. OV166]